MLKIKIGKSSFVKSIFVYFVKNPATTKKELGIANDNNRPPLLIKPRDPSTPERVDIDIARETVTNQ